MCLLKVSKDEREREERKREGERAREKGCANVSFIVTQALLLRHLHALNSQLIIEHGGNEIFVV